MNTKNPAPGDRFGGIAYMTAAMVLFSLMHAFVKFLSAIPLSEVVFFRVAISLIICTYALLKQKISLKGKNQRLLFARGLFGAASLFAFFYTIRNIPLASAVTISHLSPLFIALLGYFYLKEKLRTGTLLLFVLSLAGVMLIKGFDNRISNLEIIIALISAAFAAIAHFSIKLNSGEHPVLVIFYLPLVTLPFSLFTCGEWITPPLNELLILILIGLLSHYAQYFLTKAYQAEKTVVLAPLYYTGIIFALAFGYFFFNENFSWEIYAGMLIIICSTLLHMYLSTKARPDKSN